MEHNIKTTQKGIVKEIFFKVGQSISSKDLIIQLE